MPEIYVSTDIESDGPIPGPHSMLSLGSAAYRNDGSLVATFEANLETLDGAEAHPATMEWWRRHTEAWQACRRNTISPEDAMRRYDRWLSGLSGKPVFVGYPVGFDFLFVYWYLVRFVGRSPFSHAAIDIRTYAMATLGVAYSEATKQRLPKALLSTRRHTHRALDDAIEQGELFCNLLAYRRISTQGGT